MTIGVYPGSFDPLTVAHLHIARAAVSQLKLSRVDLALSRRTLGKDHLDPYSAERRLGTLKRLLHDEPALNVVLLDAELVVEVAAGYDAVIMGADKWTQVNDPAWYGGDPVSRDRAVAALPRVAVAPRGGVHVPDELRLRIPAELAEVSSTGVRAGRTEWAVGH